MPQKSYDGVIKQDNEFDLYSTEQPGLIDELWGQ